MFRRCYLGLKTAAHTPRMLRAKSAALSASGVALIACSAASMAYSVGIGVYGGYYMYKLRNKARATNQKDEKNEKVNGIMTKARRDFALDLNSALKITGNSKQVVVYGFDHCRFTDVYYTLQACANDKNFQLNNIGHWAVTYGPKGNYMHRIQAHNDNVRTKCKTTLTNIVLENYIRFNTGQIPVPVMFCIDIDGNPHPFSVENMLSKDPKMNAIITHKELRRACKLCHHSNPGIQQAADKTFKFVKLNKNNGVYSLEEIPSPCHTSEYNMFLEKRKADAKLQGKNKSWREQLDTHVEAHHRQTKP